MKPGNKGGEQSFKKKTYFSFLNQITFLLEEASPSALMSGGCQTQLLL